MYTFLTDVNVNELAHALNYNVSDGGISIGSIDILWTLIRSEEHTSELQSH